MEMLDVVNFYRGKRVLVTGHTGFKGSWLSHILLGAGAQVTGFSLPPDTEPNLFSLIHLDDRMQSCFGDIADIDSIRKVFEKARPEIVLHLAAQPLVRRSYDEPVRTYLTNVMGTVNLLECARGSSSLRSLLNVTTDKVYKNNEWEWGYRENDALDGFDPYSNSKSCSELVTHSYCRAFFNDLGIPVSTARAGNVIGGGDFSKDRIIPDCVRAAEKSEMICVRNPNSVRPYQHVLEPLFAYLMIAQRQYEDKRLAGCYNIGPDEEDCASTGRLVDIFCNCWEGTKWAAIGNNGPHEANFLKLDCSRIKAVFGWHPKWHIAQAVKNTVHWSRAYIAQEKLEPVMDQQINEYLNNEEQEYV